MSTTVASPEQIPEPSLDKSNARIRAMFGKIAPYYDLLNHLLSLNIDKRWRARTVKMVPPIAGQGPVLDLCTGSGDLALAYQKASNGTVPVYGADFCGPLLDRASKKSKAPNQRAGEPIRYLQADTQHLPFADNLFQIVSVAFGLRNVADTDRGLSEMARVCKPGGKVVVLEFSKPRVKVLDKLYLWYFRSVLPKVGQWFSKSPDAAYKYLPASVLSFPDYEALCEKMQAQGLMSVTYHPLTFGVATIYIGCKPEAGNKIIQGERNMIQILCRRAGSSQAQIIQAEELTAALADHSNVLWIDICLHTEGVPKTGEFLTKQFAFHPLAIEDALLETHLARVDDWQKYLYMAFHTLEFSKNDIHQHELDVFLGPNYLITIHFDQIEPIQKLWDQVIKSTDTRLIHSSDRLLYQLLDKITTASMQVVDCLDDAMDSLEQEIFVKPRRDHLPQLFRIRRHVLQLRRIFGSQREAMNRLARDSFGVVHPENRVYFRDIYDHLVRMHELSDGLRDMASGALESHISVTSYRMNEVMKTLTVVTVLFMPLTFITGYFGMNFFADQYNIPNPFSPMSLFVICMVILALTPLLMLYWMKQRGWLNSQLDNPLVDEPSDSKP